MATKVTLTIGKLAREAGVSVETIRYYQKRGLLDQPARPLMGGFRCYSDRDVGRVRFIKRAQQMGFTLAEIAELVTHTDNKNCQAAKMLAEVKLKTIESQLVVLEKVRETLKSLIVDCRRDCPRSCPILHKFHGGPLLQE
jgi:MerR family mercuric resistance operon transcriptional regulator